MQEVFGMAESNVDLDTVFLTLTCHAEHLISSRAARLRYQRVETVSVVASCAPQQTSTRWNSGRD